MWGRGEDLEECVCMCVCVRVGGDEGGVCVKGEEMEGGVCVSEECVRGEMEGGRDGGRR